MTDLELWLQQATRCLSADSAAQVRREIEEHFATAREAATCNGTSQADAERAGLAALGNARTANRQYRRVLLTQREARILRQSAWEAGALCGRGWLRWFVLFCTVVAFVAGVGMWIAGSIYLWKMLLVVGCGLGLTAVPMFLVIFTPLRSRIYRLVKWTCILAAMILGCGVFNLQWWLLLVCIWPTLWIELNRAVIRRKMPQAEWPKHLYL